MNSINTNSRIADNTNNNLNNTNNTNTIVKEDTSMNINTNTVANTIARIARRSAALLALGGLLALSHTAQADIVVDRWVGTSQALGVPAGSTIMQLKVRNTDNYTVSGVQIATLLFTPRLRDFTAPTSSAFSLAPYQSKWINVVIPARGYNGTALYGQQLGGSAWLSGKASFAINFQDVAPAANVQAGDITMTGQSNGADLFTVTFTNNGYVASQAQTATVSTWQYADGQVGQAHNQTVNIPALAVGASYMVTLSSQATQGYDIKGYVQVGTGSEVNFQF